VTPIATGATAIGLVGCGSWGRLILRDLRSLGCAVDVVAQSDATHGNAADGGARAIVRDTDDLPRDLDGYIVATPIATNAAVIDRLVARGRPIFCEKPLTDDPAAARRLATAAGERLFVMDKWRYHGGVLALAQIARDGALGPVERLRMRRVGWALSHPGDAIWTLAPHDISIALEILGHIPAPHAAFAEHSGGAPTGLLGVLGAQADVVIEVSTRVPAAARSIELACRDGVAALGDSLADHIVIRRNGESEPRRQAISTAMPLLAELRAFVDHLHGGPPPKSSAADGVAIVEILDAFRRLAGL
jgi:predicted dehydrogenase